MGRSLMRLIDRRAARHRQRLGGVTFVGVTGSCGKTTTKDLVAAVLARSGRVTSTPDNHNSSHWVARTVLAARPDQAFCVHEISAGGPGSLDAPIALVRPRVAVVTTIGSDHRAAFRTLEGTAAEKQKLVAAVPADGMAVLNADDPRVLAMAGVCRGRVWTYGLGHTADVRADSVTSEWPAHLSFAVQHAGNSRPVRTRLNGAHFVQASLAAITTGLALGVPLADAVDALATVEPHPGRLSEVVARGVTFLRDEYKAPVMSVAPALEVLRSARASRKVAVFGTLSDYHGSSSGAYSSVARRALDVADEVIFVGPQAERCRRARAHPNGAALHMFARLRDASAHLDRTLGPGDLVLLKGSQRADHLLRLVLARSTRMVCWRAGCRRVKFCDGCVLRLVPELPHLTRLPRFRPVVATTESADG